MRNGIIMYGMVRYGILRYGSYVERGVLYARVRYNNAWYVTRLRYGTVG